MNKAITQGWLSRDSLMNNAFQQKMTENLNGQIQIEPINDFKIDLKFNQNRSENFVAYYKYDNLQNSIVGPMSPTRTGNFSTSIITIKTLFNGMGEDNFSQTFQDFLDYRLIIANRLASNNPNYSGNMVYDTIYGGFFPDGYGPSSQQVLIPAFLAAYTGTDPNSRSLNPFLNIPLPNWDITYTGLSKIKKFQKYISSATLSSSYKSTYSIGSLHSDIRVPIDDRYDYGYEWVRNELNNNYIPRDVIDQITINETFSPLIKLDVNLKNSFQANFDIGKDRNLSMSFANNQLTEISRIRMSFGTGYRFKDVELNIRAGETARNLKSDIDVKLNITWSQNTTILRKVDQAVNLMSSGSDVFSLNLRGEYALSEKMILTAFYEMTINTPYVSNAFKNSTTQGGFSLRITL